MIRKSNRRIRAGFTLVELMIVIAIIGILAAIATQQFTVYKARSYNAVSRSDLKNAYTAAQAFFTDNPTSTFTPADLAAKGFLATPGVDFDITDGTQSGLTLTATNANAGAAAILYTMFASGVITP